MSTVVVLGVLWALVGVPFLVRVIQERKPLPMEQFQRAMGALQTQQPTNGTGAGAAQRRRLVSTLIYTPGLVLVALGLGLSDTAVVVVGVALVNLGTAYRLLAYAVDRSAKARPTPLATMAGSASLVDGVPFTNGNGHALHPGIDEGAGDAQTWGDGWQIIGPEPRRIDDLVLVDADLA